MLQNGSITEHGRERPLYESTAYQIEISESIPVEFADSLETLRDELDAVLSKYGVKAKITVVQVLSLLPADS